MATLTHFSNIFRPVSAAARAARISRERQFHPNYSFVFSEDLNKWIRSGKVTTIEYRKAKPRF